MEPQFQHQGFLRVGLLAVSWRQEPNGEITFQIKNQGPHLTLQALLKSLNRIDKRSTADDENQLLVINQLLAQFRPDAYPTGNYFAAAAGVTTDGSLFVHVNNDHTVKDEFAGRGCAETRMLRKAQDARHTDIQFSRVYLMSGVATKRGDKFTYTPGDVSCLCGECRQNLRTHMAHKAEFVMLPTNDGTMGLNIVSADTADDLKPGQAWRIGRKQMYPLPEVKRLDEKDFPGIQAAVSAGHAYITAVEEPALPLETDLTARGHAWASWQGKMSKAQTHEMQSDMQLLLASYEQIDPAPPALSEYPSITNINRAMLQLMKRAYGMHSARFDPEDPKKNAEITVLLIKTNEGKFYSAYSVEGSGLTAKPERHSVALANMFNQTGGIEHIYAMTFNDQKIREEMALKPKKAHHKVKMPNPAAFGRIIKNLPADNDPLMDFFPPNNGRLSEDELRAILPEPVYVRDAFGPDFSNPKRLSAKERGM